MLQYMAGYLLLRHTSLWVSRHLGHGLSCKICTGTHAGRQKKGHAVEQECAPAHCAERCEEGLADGKCYHEVDCGRKALRTRTTAWYATSGVVYIYPAYWQFTQQ